MTGGTAILLPNWIGDTVMATPTLRALRRGAGRGTRMVGLGRAAVCELLAGGSQLDELWPISTERRFPFDRSLRLAARLRAGRFDLAVLLTNGLGAALAARLAGIGERVGYARHGRGPLLTRALPPPREAGRLRPVPAIDYFLAIAAAIGCPGETPEMELATTPAGEAEADGFWRSLGGRRNRPMILLNNGAATASAKLWPAASMAELARRLVQNFDANVLVLAAPDGREGAMRIVELAASPPVMLLPVTGIGMAKACIRRAHLMVSTDSGPRHMAVALGVPVVSLFGKTDPRWTDLHSSLDLVVGEEDPRGLGQETLAAGRRQPGMTEPRVEQAWQAIERHWALHRR
jgi:heptosyltransferase-2